MTKTVKYDNNSPVYLFTNENVREYIAKSGGVKNKNVLTVASSGDHAFEALLAGAKHVDTFDINIMQKSVMDLKTRMIRNLDYDKFMDFFFSKKIRFKLDLLEPIEKNLSRNEIMLLMNLTLGKFTQFNETYNLENITYLQNRNKYKDLQAILPQEFDFKHVDIKQLPHTINQKYDVMMLSNIFETMLPGIEDAMIAMLYYHMEVLRPLSKKLNDTNGIIFIDYLWGMNHVPTKNYVDYWTSFLKAYNQRTPENHNFKLQTVKSTKKMTSVDLVMYMQQKSK